ncbi:MAG: hypothetical protein H0W03_05135 [Solirubrobacterales bacterium]|nr:hypothetical protein [Solirubrobacterales bacterium]
MLERGTTQPEQIELALGQALERGLTTPRRLAGAASCRPTTVRTKLDRLVAMA